MNKRTVETPWMVVDLMKNEVVGYYDSEISALMAHQGEPVDVQYRPLRKRRATRSFP